MESIIRRGFIPVTLSQLKPQEDIFPGENDSQSTSAHSMRSCITSSACGEFMFRARESLPALAVSKSAERSKPGSLSQTGRKPRAASGLCIDSTLTTVAPRSARARVVNGPARDHMKSTTFTPASGDDTAELSRPTDEISLVVERISLVSAPSSATCVASVKGDCLVRAKGPGAVIVLSATLM